ncbi:MAG: hypothetical protein K5643_05000 [Saccharofermentans sp.]|nr:hypothetical protein [Saccharofermentans sp.]
MRKIVVIFVFFSVILSCVSSCSKRTSVESTKKIEYADSVSQADIERRISQVSDEKIKSSLFDEIPCEKKYNRIVVNIKQSVYKIDEKHIECTVTNQNKGYGFWFCWLVFLEQETQTGWIPVEFKPGYLDANDDYYAFCAILDNPTIEYSTQVMIDTEKAFYEGQLKEGKYRLKIYVGKEIHYAEFEIQD